MMTPVTLGYRGHADWRDMSEYVVHFAKETPDRSGYDTIMSILSEQRLMAGGEFGIARGLNGLGNTQKSVCFSEVPLDRLDRLVDRRGTKYAIGFRQDVLVQAGGGRVWYVDKDSPFWRVTPFIDFPGDYGATEYRFEWEREWRVPGDMCFTPDQVAFLFIPGELHDAARAFFQGQNLGPAFDCPFLDPLWPDVAIQEALATL
jgi:hypothetical protein